MENVSTANGGSRKLKDECPRKAEAIQYPNEVFRENTLLVGNGSESIGRKGQMVILPTTIVLNSRGSQKDTRELYSE